MKKILAILLLLLLLTHPALSFEGASRGLLLWSQTVLPTLLPFMICSNVIVAVGALPLFIAPFRPFLRHVLHLSDDGGYVLVSGLLCGYPMGAKTCGEFRLLNRLSQAEASCLLAISNHSSPMFLLGYTAASLCPQVPIWTVMAALYLPILPIAFLAGKVYGSDYRQIHTHADTGTDSRSPLPDFDFDAIMMNSIEIMVRIGGYIMLFSILAVFIQSVPGPISPSLKAILLGTAEITTGIRAVSLSMTGWNQGFWITAIVAFGGLSGIFQTRSVTKNAGLNIRHYILWKLLHTAVSCLIFILLAGTLPYVH